MSDTVISVISLCVTFLLAILGFIVNALLQRKNHSIQVITSKRLERRESLQKSFAAILLLSDSDYLEVLEKDKRAEKYTELINEKYQVKVLLEMTSDPDADIMNAISQLVNDVGLYIFDDNKCLEKLAKDRITLSRLTDLYIETEWQRIKLETVGKNRRKHKKYANWQKLHAEKASKFKENVNMEFVKTRER